MQVVCFEIAGINLSIEFSDSFSPYVDILFPHFTKQFIDQIDIDFTVNEYHNGLFELFEADKSIVKDLDANQAALGLMNEVVRSVAETTTSYIALHAAAVTRNNISVVIPAKTGSGKTSISAWLVSKGYHYLTDELILFEKDSVKFMPFYRPLNIKSSGLEAVTPLLQNFDEQQQIMADSITVWPADFIGESAIISKSLIVNLFVFPSYQQDCELKIEALTPAQIGLELMACNVNARNLDGHGFKDITTIAKQVTGLRLVYSDFEQLEGLLPKLIELIGCGDVDRGFLNKLLQSGVTNRTPQVDVIQEHKSPIPEATPTFEKKKLCIGMATYDDYDGVYFSTQALRLYHPEVTDDTEIIVIDNHPTGKCAQDLKALDKKVKNFRYIPVAGKTGTAVIKNLIFEHTDADYVLCMDCHVFVEPGAISKLLDYCDAHPDSADLLQGPMLHDDLNSVSTHFEPVWRGGMYGIWAHDDRGNNSTAQPFEIPMQGMGLFACSRKNWPGFNQNFRGFGFEEGYIHEKIRQAGGKTMCLPFLRWMHRFARPMGVPYPINWSDRVRNYLIGLTELGLDTLPVIEHFNEHLNEAATSDYVEAFEKEFGKST